MALAALIDGNKSRPLKLPASNGGLAYCLGHPKKPLTLSKRGP